MAEGKSRVIEFRNHICSKSYIIRNLTVLLALLVGLLYQHSHWWFYLVAIPLYICIVLVLDYILLVLLHGKYNHK